MNYSTTLSSWDDEIRARVLLLAGVSGEALRVGPWFSGDDPTTRNVQLLAVLYIGLTRTLGFPPTPAMLPHLGWPGRHLHRLFCRHAGMWEALRSLVERLSDIPCQTPTSEGNVRLHSRPERFVYRVLRATFGVASVDPHPALPGGGKKEADFLVTSVTGHSVYVEVAMTPSQADVFETSVLAKYRKDLVQKLALYNALGIEPVVVWGDEAASPRALDAKLNVIRARIGVPAQPPAPAAWYEEVA